MSLVSVVTVVRDNVLGLAKTHKSLLKQDIQDWEFLIVVGLSVDSSLSYATKLQLQDPRVRVIEQSGLGIYPAMNQGTDCATGEFIWFMNSGDQFANSSVLRHGIEALREHRAGIIIGDYRLDSNVKFKNFHYPSGQVSPSKFAFNRRGGCHQAMIFQREAILRAGGFCAEYSLAGDFDLVLRIMKDMGAFRVPKIFALIEPGGRADQDIFLVHKQKHMIRKNLLGGPYAYTASILWTCFAHIKIALKPSCARKIFSKFVGHFSKDM